MNQNQNIFIPTLYPLNGFHEPLQIYGITKIIKIAKLNVCFKFIQIIQRKVLSEFSFILNLILLNFSINRLS